MTDYRYSRGVRDSGITWTAETLDTFDSTIAYLSRAKEVHSTSPDARTYSERIKATFPERQQQGWVDYSTDFLYGPARPR